MNKVVTHSYQGMNKDINKSNYPNTFYFEGKNIRIVATDTQSTGAVTNEKGNSLILQVPIPEISPENTWIEYQTNEGLKTLPYSTEGTTQPRSEIESEYYISENNYRASGNQIIIGHGLIRNHIILFTTDNNGFDCIWKVNDSTYEISLLYMRDLGFSTSNPIQCISNYENEIIDKIYWVDGENQLRFINTLHSTDNGDLENLIDLPKDSINSVSGFNLSQPLIADIVGGGTHTAGKIQYAYNLFRLNNSQTKLSPLSELVSLTKGPNLGGGDVNEIVGATPIVQINDIDQNYTHIRIYGIKYTSYNVQPSISLIYEREIANNSTITYFDDGSIVQPISLDEFLFLGSDIIIPQHINTKKNYMFLANYREQNFDIDLDMRAYSFNSVGVSEIYDNVRPTSSGGVTGDVLTVPSTFIVPENFDAVNLDYNNYKYQSDGILLGGEGKYIKYELTQTTENLNKRFFKDEEVYRIGIQLYNGRGQVSLPKWMADFKAPKGNLQENFNTLTVTLQPEFYVWLNTSSNFESEDDKPVGYKILRADRQLKDRTIVSSGLLSTMMVNNKDGNPDDSDAYKRPRSKVNPKLPNILVRRFDDGLMPMRTSEHLRRLDIDSGLDNNYQTEIHYNGTARVASTYQFNSMMQLYSPEILFGDFIRLNPDLNLRIKGGIKNSYNAFWGQERSVETKQPHQEGKVFNGISPHYVSGTDKVSLRGNVDNLLDEGLIAHPGGSDPNFMAFDQYYRVFGKYNGSTGFFIPSVNNVLSSIYGSPEITERGQGITTYNNDNNYQYANSLESLITDGNDDYDDSGVAGRAITSVNSWGARTITFVTGSDNPAIENWNRPLYEGLKGATGIADNDIGLIGELIIPNNQLYLGNIYGGNSFEDKKRTNYIEIGEYKKISENINIINSPGDTYVGNFKFERISKTDTEIYAQTSLQYTEIVEVTLETTIELTSRNDESLSAWDSRFQPRYTDFHKYNDVYSQQSNLIIRKDVDYKFKKVEGFDVNVIATKIKVPGEIIDSWTDLLVNEVLSLDGKYGPINSLHNFKGELFTLQDSALARLSILPRIQVGGSDGSQVELGFGNVLQEYIYITTDSGTKNKWGVVNSPSAFYFYDSLNSSINIFKGDVGGLTDLKGLHTYFQNNIDSSLLNIDNPILKNGVSCGYDYINNNVFFTFLQNTKTFTINYDESEGVESFVSFYDYFPSMYISRGDNFITTSPDNRAIYKQYDGDYNTFYGVKYPSYIILNVNPEPNFDCVFDNINYKSEVTLNGIDQPNFTLTRIQAFNEYQNSGLIPLSLGRNFNLRRKFRDWHALIPRQGRQRIRNPYIYLKLQFDNPNNYKLVLHNMNIYYTVNNTL